ncbi:hypothetical protein [Rhizobium mongolense]|uniref:Microsomal dipeptidase-like Zn-dependent dipeptidase n=1 Tax=Rhizobium mongolense TaxID=57676 RepID=A0A7W6RLS6_9HYPH|nr:hypothetical protein [Rhizobium mongolense]MBB4274140.1 microsomal dipeptidase-like Zn-dependent dipeptidase [Rhizobium mongolense]
MEADAAAPVEESSSDWRSNPTTCPDFVRSLGRIIDITGLDGVTVAYDYDDALAQGVV